MTDPRFDPAQVFRVFGMRHVDTAGFDAAVVQAPGADLRCVFLWGQDCYNCNLFKQAALLHQETLVGLGLTWFEADVYADEPLGRRFSLHGVPTFVLYRSGKRLGRITGWPGLPQFTAAIHRLQESGAENSSPAS
ncbi:MULTISPECIES: thioredoxin family protein [Achromobacter]|jgi:hypothetical protein|uniref:thioredoxin family protein n=1 Tax=Achromobacter TaxID=222 RepID=UPI0006FB3798|nr:MULTISPECIES: thioredoxin family protein [Achromobacter]KRB12804.1 thioredoxin [Achromobacter sp. Root170]MDH1524056.1 thioredoxin family protein [Achromobacter mucicolens]TQJ94432.1 hypothetical protein FBY20_1162 [Achromobacter sp. SLBN-14]